MVGNPAELQISVMMGQLGSASTSGRIQIPARYPGSRLPYSFLKFLLRNRSGLNSLLHSGLNMSLASQGETSSITVDLRVCMPR